MNFTVDCCGDLALDFGSKAVDSNRRQRNTASCAGSERGLLGNLMLHALKLEFVTNVHVSNFFMTQKLRLCNFLHGHQWESNGIESISKNTSLAFSCQWNRQTAALLSRPSHSRSKKLNLLGNQRVAGEKVGERTVVYFNETVVV